MWVVHKELTRALNDQFTLTLNLDLEAAHRYIIFSDQHKGACDKADDFMNSKSTYLHALEHYRDKGFSLILLGDVEELWEQRFKPVEECHGDVLKLEGSFLPGRYYRVWGNHDDYWMIFRHVRKWLARYMPVKTLYEAIRFEVIDKSKYIGTILMLHGHQGTFESDIIRGLSKVFLRFIYRPLQRATGIGRTTPAKDFCLNEEHDKEMYRWATEQKNLLLVTGHTHRPVWTSRTHLQKLEQELIIEENKPESAEKKLKIEQLKKQIEKRRKDFRECNGNHNPATVHDPVPVYFNTGCCRYEDGDITGIEIENGTMRLVKWDKISLASEKLEEEKLTIIFRKVKEIQEV